MMRVPTSVKLPLQNHKPEKRHQPLKKSNPSQGADLTGSGRGVVDAILISKSQITQCFWLDRCSLGFYSGFTLNYSEFPDGCVLYSSTSLIICLLIFNSFLSARYLVPTQMSVPGNDHSSLSLQPGILVNSSISKRHLKT